MLSAKEARQRIDEMHSDRGQRLMELAESQIIAAVEDGLSSVSVEVPYRYHEPLKNSLQALGYKVNCGEDQREGSWFQVSW